jgi:3-phenylpropionate/trans-cinnamate dioxygenase ferredoxin subunit
MKTETGARVRKSRSKVQPGWQAVATTAEIPVGERKVVEAGEQSLVVCNVAGVYYALADVCTHDGGPLGEGLFYDHEVQCPRHGARFDVCTGKVLSFPAVVDVPAYPVKVDGDRILVQLASGEF